MKISVFEQFPLKTQRAILEATFEENSSHIPQRHSLQTLFKEKRELSVASRLTSGTISINNKNLTGQEIAELHIKAVKETGFSYFPLSGDWKNTNIESLIVFVKLSGRFEPYARFLIQEIIATTVAPTDSNEHFSEKNFLSAFKNFKSVLKITNVETTNLPTSFMGIRSGVDIYELAFKGSSPNILVI